MQLFSTSPDLTTLQDGPSVGGSLESELVSSSTMLETRELSLTAVSVNDEKQLSIDSLGVDEKQESLNEPGVHSRVMDLRIAVLR